MGKKVLLYEGMRGHGECLSSYYTYFRKLGYDVDVVSTDRVINEKPLWMVKEPVNIYSITNPSSANYAIMIKHLEEIRTKVPNFFDYDIYFIGTFNKDGYQFVKYLHDHGISKNRILHQNHVNYKTYMGQCGRDVTLGWNGFTLGMVDHDKLPQLPPSINITGKNHQLLETDLADKEITLFISGLSHVHFGNFELFVKALDEVNKEGINIKVNVCGIREQGTYVMPVSKNVNYLGRLSFRDMTDAYCKNDFLFVLFDENAISCRVEHKMFLDGRVSGSRNMSIMYKIPLVVQKPYQLAWGFDDNNCIAYEGRNYKEILMSLYNMKKEQYNKIIKALQKKEKEELQLGLKNLQDRINGLSSNKYIETINPIIVKVPITKKKMDFIHFKPRKGPWI